MGRPGRRRNRTAGMTSCSRSRPPPRSPAAPLRTCAGAGLEKRSQRTPTETARASSTLVNQGVRQSLGRWNGESAAAPRPGPGGFSGLLLRTVTPPGLTTVHRGPLPHPGWSQAGRATAPPSYLPNNNTVICAALAFHFGRCLNRERESSSSRSSSIRQPINSSTDCRRPQALPFRCASAAFLV